MIFTHAISRLPWPGKRPASCSLSGDWTTSGEARAFYCSLQEHSVTNCGSGTPRRFVPAKCASRRPITAIQQEAKTEDDTIVIDIDSAVTRRALEARRAEREQSKENPS